MCYILLNIIVFKIYTNTCKIKLNLNLICFIHKAIQNVLDIFSQLSTTDTIKKATGIMSMSQNFRWIIATKF